MVSCYVNAWFKKIVDYQWTKSLKRVPRIREHVTVKQLSKKAIATKRTLKSARTFSKDGRFQIVDICGTAEDNVCAGLFWRCCHTC